MATLDPLLAAFMQSVPLADTVRLVQSRFVAVQVIDGVPHVEVLVELEDTVDVNQLRTLGLNVPAEVPAGLVLTARLPPGRIDALREAPGIRRIDASRPMVYEMDAARAEIGLPPAPTPGGHGVAIAIVDSGIDFENPIFWREGRTQIDAIWDQQLMPLGHERSPVEFGYGVEYSAQDIEAHDAGGPPVRHRDTQHEQCHGSAVACIAAGGRFALDFGEGSGVAPDARLLCVALGPAPSYATVLDGVRWTVARADSRPVVVNLSLGFNSGPHDGTSVFERAISDIAARPGVVIVKSAGNQADKAQHAEGIVGSAGDTVAVTIEPNLAYGYVEFWHDGPEAAMLAVVPPAAVPAGTTIAIGQVQEVPGGFILTQQASHGSRHGIAVVLVSTSGAGLPAGVWRCQLRTAVEGTAWHAWCGPSGGIVFKSHTTSAVTITTPACSHGVIVAGGYRDRPLAERGEIALYSGRGPTRDGRHPLTISAPAQNLRIAKIAGRAAEFSGTSAAAPLVTGAVALMLSAEPTLDAASVAARLEQRARRDRFTEQANNPDIWGAGKLDAASASSPPSASA